MSTKTIFLGEDSSLLDQIGLVYEKADSFDGDADLVVVGSSQRLASDQAEKYMEKGGKVVFLPVERKDGPMDTVLKGGGAAETKTDGSSVLADGFSVRWTGKVIPEHTEKYSFYTLSDDGVRLWVSDKKMIDNWKDHGSMEDTGTIDLEADKEYDLKLEYYENGGGAEMKLFWSSDSQSKQIVPADRFVTPSGENGRLKGDYFAGANLGDLILSRTDEGVDFSRGTMSPTDDAAAEDSGKFCGSLSVPDWPEADGLTASDLRWRFGASAWLLADGCEIGADGLLGRKLSGKGSAIICQIDPERFDADTKTFFRYTRWRQTRALSQVLANMGGEFEMDRQTFDLRLSTSPRIGLAGTWKAKLTRKLDPSPSPQEAHPDRGMTPEIEVMMAVDFDDSSWEDVDLPQVLDTIGGGWEGMDGEAVFRKVIIVSEELAGKDFVLKLGPIDDFDDTYFNGVKVGSVDKNVPDFWSVKREYKISGDLVKAGRKTVAIRVWDHFGGGGFYSSVEDMCAEPVKGSMGVVLYHPDYRDAFELGDDPYRYYRLLAIQPLHKAQPTRQERLPHMPGRRGSQPLQTIVDIQQRSPRRIG